MKTVNPQIPNLNETPQKQCGENQTNTSDNQMAGNFIEKKKSLQVFKNQISYNHATLALTSLPKDLRDFVYVKSVQSLSHV